MVSRLSQTLSTHLFSSLCYLQGFTYHVKEVSFVSESCTPTITSENVRIPTTKKCCSRGSMSNKQPEDLWGSSVVMAFFNTNQDRKFQSNLGLAQCKTVKWGGFISFSEDIPLFAFSPSGGTFPPICTPAGPGLLRAPQGERWADISFHPSPMKKYLSCVPFPSMQLQRTWWQWPEKCQHQR